MHGQLLGSDVGEDFSGLGHVVRKQHVQAFATCRERVCRPTPVRCSPDGGIDAGHGPLPQGGPANAGEVHVLPLHPVALHQPGDVRRPHVPRLQLLGVGGETIRIYRDLPKAKARLIPVSRVVRRDSCEEGDLEAVASAQVVTESEHSPSDSTPPVFRRHNHGTHHQRADRLSHQARADRCEQDVPRDLFVSPRDYRIPAVEGGTVRPDVIDKVTLTRPAEPPAVHRVDCVLVAWSLAPDVDGRVAHRCCPGLRGQLGCHIHTGRDAVAG